MRPLALITGASSGIGLELARIHARSGNLIIVSRSTSRLLEVKDELEEQYDIEVHIIPKDLSIPDSAEELFDEVKELELVPDYLINNAGIGDYGFFHEADWYKQESMINLNILTLTHLTWLFGREMIEHGSGKIMNIASTAAFQPGPMMSVYHASKHYVLAFSEGIANEWKDFGVTVTALCPGPTLSEFQKEAGMNLSKPMADGKLANPAEVAAYGYRAMLDGQVVAIHGLKNRLMATGFKLMPKSLASKTIRKL